MRWLAIKRNIQGWWKWRVKKHKVGWCSNTGVKFAADDPYAIPGRAYTARELAESSPVYWAIEYKREFR